MSTSHDNFIARHHPQLEVTGISAESGGWIARRPFLYDDPVYPGAFPQAQVAVRRRLEQLFSSGQIDLADLPPPLSEPAGREGGHLPAHRVRGILLGTAIGDALGNTSESMTASRRRAQYGEIREYLPNRHLGGVAAGLPSDDTQLSVWTLEALLDAGQPDADSIAAAYRRYPMFGMGQTMRGFLDALGHPSKLGDVWEARQRSAGNGALMRIAGAFLPHAWTLDAGTLDTVALTSALTHDHASSTGACVAFARILGEILWRGNSVPNGFFWETYVETARVVEGQQQLHSRVPGDAYCGPVWQLVADRVPVALRNSRSTVAACNRWYSGAFVLETVPTILFLLERYRDDPEEALVRAVMDTWDNDTVAAIVGAVLGALHGEDAFPARWRDGLLGRTTSNDDGKVQAILGRLRQYGGNGLDD